MIVSWNWLTEYVRLDLSVDEVIGRLMMSGTNHEGTLEVEGDIAIDLEVTSNRPDCLGHLGIAREIAALSGRELKLPRTDFREGDRSVAEITCVDVLAEASAWCPRYRARVIENVRIGPSPDWMQRRLKTVGLAPINNVVDITNYVLLECGQPLHAFDFEKLAGKKIIVRNAKPKEKFLAIDNREYELEPWMGVIADAERAVALAGVMGGADTEITDQTKTVLLETAEFDPLTVRQGSRALDLSSESSYRFERKIDPAGVAWASDRATHLLAELAGGTVASGYLHVGKSDYARESIPLRLSRIKRILGIDIPAAEVERILSSLGLTVGDRTGDSITATPPSCRRDLTREIDLIEEVGRIHGYDAIPEDRVIPLAVSPRSRLDHISDILRDCLAGLGYCECVTYSFTNRKRLASIRPWSTAEPLAVDHSSRRQENLLRQSLLPSLLESLVLNLARGNEDVDLFEIAQVFLPQGKGELPDEPEVIGLASPHDWRTVRGHLELVFDRLRIEPDFALAPVEGFDPDRGAEWRLAGACIGRIGHPSRQVADAFDLRSDAVLAELLIEPLVQSAQMVAKAEPIPDQPAMVRDSNFVLDESVRWSELETTARQAAGPLLERLQFVDLYRGKQVAAGKKSITFRITYRAADRTLTGAEVDGYQRTVVAAVAEKLGGELR